ncbi:MAG: ATP-grasp domain-containing protein [Shimia sp.]
METGRIMVLGTNAGQADLIRHMKERGWVVIGCSPVVGEPGQALCDIYEQVDIRDMDALTELVQRHGVDLVYSISSDVAMRSVVRLSEALGLPHFYDSAFIDLLDDKAALRAFLAERDLGPVPFAKVSDAAELAGWSVFPAMVKPTDAQGQRGITRVDDTVQLMRALPEATGASRSGQAIVEGFLDGVEVSCNVVVSGGEIRMRVLSERLVHGPHALGVPRGHLVPCRNVSAEEEAQAQALVVAIVEAFGCRDGVLYFQMILTPEGPRVVEIAPRLDGCHMWRLIEAVTGANKIEMAVDALLGRPVATLPGDGVGWTPETRPAALHELMFQQCAPGTPFDPAGMPRPADALYHEYRYAGGEVVRPVNGTLDVVGYYTRQGDGT